MSSVLVIEDDHGTATEIAAELTSHGYQVTHAATASEGLRQARAMPFDIITVDRMLPDCDGLAVIEHMRTEGIRTPALVLSALGQVEERVAGLRAGGDDYLTKPFAFIELRARLEALLRRPASAKTEIQVGDLTVDLIARSARRGERAIDLLPREFLILEHLALRVGQVVTRAMLFEQVWRYRFDPRTNVIDVHVSHLRQKLHAGGEAPVLHTVRGEGFLLRAPPA
jgi:two-component system OmpR family response regulator